MISDKPVIELSVLVYGDEREYFISGHNGRFDWELLQEFEDGLTEDPLPDIEELINEPNLTNGQIKVIAHLSYIEAEIQHGTGYGDINTLPAYYDFTLIEVVSVDKYEDLTEMSKMELF